MPPFGLSYGGALTDPEIRAHRRLHFRLVHSAEEAATGSDGGGAQVVDPNTIETVSFART